MVTALSSCLSSKIALGQVKVLGLGTVCFVPCEILKHFSVPLSTTYITCPADPKKTLGIKLPFLVMIIKNLKKYFTFEVQVRRAEWGVPSGTSEEAARGPALVLEL